MSVGARTKDYELTASQQFQNFSGTLRGREIKIDSGKLEGDRITLDFRAEVDGDLLQHRFVGRVSGNSIAGTAALTGERVQGEAEWKLCVSRRRRAEVNRPGARASLRNDLPAA